MNSPPDPDPYPDDVDAAIRAPRGRPLTPVRKLRLAATMWRTLLRVHWLLRRHPLPHAVHRLAEEGAATGPALPAPRLSRAVDRTLRIGPWHPRCLIGSLVLFGMLRWQGDQADLVIGLPDHPDDHEAHAWVELDGVDVGPPPGKGHHQELARYR